MTTEHYIDAITEHLKALSQGDVKQLENGTLLIKPKHDREPWEPGYYHVIQGPLNDEQIAQMEVMIQRKLPPSLKEVYLRANGGQIFLDSFSWQGLRQDNSRALGQWLPVSLECGNTIGRPLEGPPGKERIADNSNQLRFGIYVEYDVEVMMRLDGDPKVYAVPRYKLGPVLYEWPDVQTFFVSEVERMTALFKKSVKDSPAFEPFAPPWEEQK